MGARKRERSPFLSYTRLDNWQSRSICVGTWRPFYHFFTQSPELGCFDLKHIDLICSRVSDLLFFRYGAFLLDMMFLLSLESRWINSALVRHYLSYAAQMAQTVLGVKHPFTVV